MSVKYRSSRRQRSGRSAPEEHKRLTVFAAQCVASVLLVLFGLVISRTTGEGFGPVRDAFKQILTADGGLKSISDAVNAFVEDTPFLSGLFGLGETADALAEQEPEGQPEPNTQETLPTSGEPAADPTADPSMIKDYSEYAVYVDYSIEDLETKEDIESRLNSIISEAAEYSTLEMTGDELPENAIDINMNLSVVLRCPLFGKITSQFGYRMHPILQRRTFHYGIDIAAPSGTPILSAAAGTVATAGYSEVYGNYLVIKHDDELYTFYGHCSKLLVKEGQEVDMLERVALVGSTGWSTGSHLHFEVRYKNCYLNPLNNIIEA